MAVQKRKDKERKIFSGVLDDRTASALLRLANKGVIDRLGGAVRSGKESSVFLAKTKEGEEKAVKIYAVEASNFRRMLDYIQGDKRFVGIGKTRQKVVYAWCRKEYSNLRRAHESKVGVPRPLAYFNNVLVMEKLGPEEGVAPQLSETKLKDPEAFLKKVVRNMRRLHKSGLVHSDLSQFNILVWKEEPYFVDMGQAVLLSHPRAQDFLERDARNIARYFKKLGVDADEKRILEDVTG